MALASGAAGAQQCICTVGIVPDFLEKGFHSCFLFHACRTFLHARALACVCRAKHRLSDKARTGPRKKDSWQMDLMNALEYDAGYECCRSYPAH